MNDKQAAVWAQFRNISIKYWTGVSNSEIQERAVAAQEHRAGHQEQASPAEPPALSRCDLDSPVHADVPS